MSKSAQTLCQTVILAQFVDHDVKNHSPHTADTQFHPSLGKQYVQQHTKSNVPNTYISTLINIVMPHKLEAWCLVVCVESHDNTFAKKAQFKATIPEYQPLYETVTICTVYQKCTVNCGETQKKSRAQFCIIPKEELNEKVRGIKHSKRPSTERERKEKDREAMGSMTTAAPRKGTSGVRHTH